MSNKHSSTNCVGCSDLTTSVFPLNHPGDPILVCPVCQADYFAEKCWRWKRFLYESRVGDTFELVEKLLAMLPQTSPIGDLKARGIKAIVVVKNEHPAMLDCNSTKEYFIVSVPSGDSIDEWIKAIGHELGHTIIFGDVFMSPIMDPIVLKTSPEEEIFCELFSREWEKLHINNDQLHRWLKTELYTPQ